MDSYTIPVGKFFDDKVCLMVPLFQRPYVWLKEEQWEPLWNDIIGVCNRLAASTDPRPHFIGAVVLEVLPRKVGQLDRRLVIDGQQRLTTMQIILRAFADVVPESDPTTQLQKDLTSLVTNNHSNVKEPWERFKLWPTNADRDAFQEIMSVGGAEELVQKYHEAKSLPRLVEAYMFFSSRLEQWLKPQTAGFRERVEQLQTAITQCLNIVVIDIEDQDDSQVIFETLNARGTPLLPADLIKNAILSRARWEKANEEELYLKYWRIFDVDPYWREEVGRGHARRARVDLFLQNYLTARTLEEVPVSHLYATFRDWVNAMKQTAEWHCADVHRYAAIYRKLQQWPEISPEKVFLYRLDTLGIVTAGPFLLELFHKYHSARRAEVQEVLRDLESFLIRRTICGLSTRGYNRLFLDLTKIVGTEENFLAAIRAKLEASGASSMRWPSDGEFSRAWNSRPVAAELRRERVRIILEAVELGLRSSKSETLTFNEALQVEHLMPDAWEKHYPLPPNSNRDAKVERDRIVHTLGNLSLLTESLNPSVSNGPWTKKRSEILIHSALALNRSLAAEEWTESQIATRSSELFQVALRVWPAPKTTSEEKTEEFDDISYEDSSDSLEFIANEPSKRLTPVDFREACFARLCTALGVALAKKTQAIRASSDGKLGCLCVSSKAFSNSDGTGYWFAFHPHQQESLRQFERAFVAFACGSPEQLILIPYGEFQLWLPTLNRTPMSERTYWHVKFRESNGHWFNTPKAEHPKREVTKYLVSKTT